MFSLVSTASTTIKSDANHTRVLIEKEDGTVEVIFTGGKFCEETYKKRCKDAGGREFNLDVPSQSEADAVIKEYKALYDEDDSLEDYLKKFDKFAQKNFEAADEDTLEYRKQLLKSGFSVAFGVGLDKREVLDVLENPGVQYLVRKYSKKSSE